MSDNPSSLPLNAVAGPMRILDSGCADGAFSKRADCSEWMKAFATYVKSRLGTFEIRLDTYYHIGNLYLTADLHNLAKRDGIPVSIVINRGCISLGDPQDFQQDIALPGLVDAFFFIKRLLTVAAYEDGATRPVSVQQGVWVTLQDKQDAW